MTVERLLSLREVADLCGVSYVTAKRWSASGRLDRVRVGGVIRVSEASLAEFQNRNTDRAVRHG
jgi:excisionase family DNA binding protein